MKNKMYVDKRAGFTLIEMIGVIAVIAILAAFIAPKVFTVIAESRATRFAGEIGTYRSAVVNWYKDIGSLQSLAADGTLVDTDTTFQIELISNQGTTPTTGFWARWDGPYVDSVANVSIGSTLTIETNAGATGTGAPAATNSTAFDLDDDNKNDMASKQVVALKLTGVANSEFLKVDGTIDLGLTVSNNATSGKIKYDSSTGTLYIFLAAD